MRRTLGQIDHLLSRIGNVLLLKTMAIPTALFIVAVVVGIADRVTEIPLGWLIVAAFALFWLLVLVLPGLGRRLRSSWVSRGSNAQLADESTELAASVSSLLADHARDEPMHWDPDDDPAQEGGHKVWAKSVNRRQVHENRTLAKYIERYQPQVVVVANELRRRKAISERELGSLLYAGRTVHWLDQVPPALLLGARRLRNGEEAEDDPRGG